MSHVRTEIVDRIARVTLARPDKMNAISLEMLGEVIAAAHALRGADISCVVIAGEGRGFCAGIDLMSLSGLMGQDMQEVLVKRTHGQTNDFQEFSRAWAALEVPVIAALHGVCYGAGMQLALGTDIRIAAPDAKLSIMEMKWGLVPDMGGMVVLPRLLRADVMRRMIYTAEVIDGATAMSLGLVTETADDPMARAMELAQLIAEQSPSAVRAAKELAACSETETAAEILLAESRLQAELVGKPDQLAAIARGMAAKKG